MSAGQKYIDLLLIIAEKLLITTEDVLRVIQTIPSTVKSHLKDKYIAWESGYGVT